MSDDDHLNADSYGPLSLGTSYRQIVDSLTQGVVIYNSLGEIVYANKSASEILGLKHSEMFGNRMSDLISLIDEDYRPVEADDFPNAHTLRTGNAIYMKAFGVDIAGKSRRWIILHTKRFVFEDGSLGVSSSFIDISEYRRSNLAASLFVALNNSVVHTTDEAALLQNMCDSVVKIGGYGLALIGFGENDPGRSISVAYASGATDYVYDGMFSWSDSNSTGRGPAGMALRTGEVQVANDLSTQPGYEPWRERAEKFGFGSSISLLFKIGTQPAVLAVYARDKFAFDESAVNLLKEIASEFGLGVAHVRTVKQLAASLDGTLAALSRLAEGRDPYTAGHQTRVASLGAAIATHLNLDKETVDLIRKSGQVHDIGKVAIPIEILTRPGQLTPLEFEMIKSHTLVGGDILAQASLPWPIAEVALQHHERLDGSGYPKGLKGSEICLPARIIAVADLVEAMSQHRPYRPARGLDETLAHISAEAGNLFDAAVVGACLEVFRMGYAFGSSTWTVSSRYI
ncbi:MAG: HD domain-containing protein [Actinomycetota bacterium]|nr:MAG: HD domain-containing protein [Actinomycetota bacterium]